MPTLAYLLLGSNLGDRAARLAQARHDLTATAGRLVAASALYETAAWGLTDQPAFLNQVLAIETDLAAPALLAACLAAEQQQGRERQVRWAARTLDVDILLFGQEILATPTLTVPHPALPARRFALVPWPSWPRSSGTRSCTKPSASCYPRVLTRCPYNELLHRRLLHLSSRCTNGCARKSTAWRAWAVGVVWGACVAPKAGIFAALYDRLLARIFTICARRREDVKMSNEH
ncbi:2-amino-4-hydroxy-6-hydroxymethyldihydropteridine diphosphokinase [Hymenobacter sp. BRD67]|uniref:2-amino-4-hydroxy-6- hydroxymethyldihydropteridine diphosphokinase n=1 Tax=Hymenobacter sp. BRD67 TaxID=2675877 RepID=UPI00293BD637|nr:2-amino-4-hydroxy-6-hydroxymethyldihydropteridine diphosphokinase [Hymenobacter sp. BRD67]